MNEVFSTVLLGIMRPFIRYPIIPTYPEPVVRFRQILTNKRFKRQKRKYYPRRILREYFKNSIFTNDIFDWVINHYKEKK